ncbi:MAG TPA: PBP1A family penicillin-binding protein, partial [Blastocatellia bacterium]|nr:PBP1A family penicillin-binding protein [Blastocatellia bacterium]
SYLSDYLRATGYQQRLDGVEENPGGSFEVNGNAILVFPGDDASSQPGVAPLRIQIDKGGRVVSLTSPMTGARLSSAAIQGRLLASVHEGDRRKKIPVQFTDIPDNLRDAVVAAEDRRFFSHSGVDWRGIVRALRTDLDQGEFVQGGSTLTQQLIKNNFLTSERTLKRKLKEAAMAVILELRLTKEQIFTHYCNGVYLGHSGTYAINGFAQAAQVYFDKDLNELTLGQSAFLAGLICAPNRYSAHRDTPRAIERRNLVLDSMVQTEAITQKEAEAAKAETLSIQKHEITDDDGTSYFIDYVQRFMEDRYRADRLSSRHQITTTMDPRLQRAAYAAVTRQTAKLDKVLSRRKGERSEPVQAALVALDAHTGEVLAMVGGRSYDESQLNRATDAKRQPGSAFKPFVYATALSSRSFTAATLLSDRPQTFTYDGGRAEYQPSDYHGGFTNRSVTLREALARSLNVPTVELAMKTGLARVAQVAEASGLEAPRIYPSMALGTSEVTPLQLASAYTAFANGGTALRPTPVRSISGTRALTDRVSASSAHVFSPQVAYLMTNLMEAVVDQGTASRLRAMGLKGAIAGKTGTSNDGWFVGYTPRIVCVAWVGFDDNRDLGMKASDAALPMWADFMTQALELRADLGGASFGKPSGIVTVEIDPSTGCLAGPNSASRRVEMFLAGTEPSSTCSDDLVADLEEIPEFDEGLQAQDLDSNASESEGEGGEMVSVEVCALTGLRASSYCPTTEIRAFLREMEPRVSCSSGFHRN